MSTQPLRITVYPTMQYGASGANGATPEQQRLQAEGWNPFNMFQLSWPQFGFNMNLLWIFALLVIVGLYMTKRR